ncbi:putative transcription regulator DDT family [Dioscorea sansibarensis]
MSDDFPAATPDSAAAAADAATVAAPSSSSSSDEQWKPSTRKTRPSRSCTSRSRARPPSPLHDRRSTRREKDDLSSSIITPLAQTPNSPSLIPRWSLRSMWELASLLNFLNVFRPLLKITVEFSVEELETALITPNSTLDDIHIPLLKAIPPVTRMALGRATWVTVLCRKLKDWWHWVADGEIPIVTSHGTEIETYKNLEPATRVLILKALCDIRVEQEDIRSYIDNSLKHGVQLSTFRKERIGGNSHGTSYWFEDDPIIGHRLYREVRQAETKKVKTKGVPHVLPVSPQWETVATNLDEFQVVSDKLLASKNKTEVNLAKKLKIDVLPEVEKIHKRKEKLLKKQHREALLLDSYMTADGLSTGRSLRDRKPVTYTFDDYDRSINEAIKITKKRQTSPEHIVNREVAKAEASNGNGTELSQTREEAYYDTASPKSNEYEESEGEDNMEPLDRSNRRRQRPQRYLEREFVQAVSDDEADFGSDDDIVGEAVYDEEYLRSRNQKKASSSSEGDEEYRWEGNSEDEDEDDSFSASEDTDEDHRNKKSSIQNKRGRKLRLVDELQSGLRRSKRFSRQHVNYRQYDQSDSDADSAKSEKSNGSSRPSDASDDMEVSTASQDSADEEHAAKEINVEEQNDSIANIEKQPQLAENLDARGKETEGAFRRKFLDLNEIAPGNGFDDDDLDTIDKDEDTGNV